MADKIYQSSNLVERPSGKLANTKTINELIREVNKQGQALSFDAPGRRRPFDDPGIWLIWNVGPNGEDDYTDNRYWLRRAFVSNSDSSEDSTTATDLKEKNNYDLNLWITATNLSERNPSTGGTPNSGTHQLTKGASIFGVYVETDSSKPPVTRYIFQSGGTGAPTSPQYSGEVYYGAAANTAAWGNLPAINSIPSS